MKTRLNGFIFPALFYQYYTILCQLSSCHATFAHFLAPFRRAIDDEESGERYSGLQVRELNTESLSAVAVVSNSTVCSFGSLSHSVDRDHSARTFPCIRSVGLSYCLLVSDSGCLGGAVVGCGTRDRKVAGSTPGRGATKSSRSTQPSIPPG